MLDQLAGGEWIASFDTVADVEALVTNLRPLAQETIRYRPHLALALRQEGRLHSQAGHHGRALDRFTEAVDLYRELVTRNPGYRQALARTLTSAARQLRYLNQRAEAAEYDVEAQRLLRDLDVEGGAQPAG
jgi:tetratricopeptide (TPR) repeat protein